MADERGFLNRWSQRKRDATAGIPEPEQTPETGDADAEAAALEEQANREAAEAVDIEALGKDSDYTVFLKRGVPDALRRRALRRLWRSDPVLACLDGLNDYEGNFGDPALNMAVFKSAWQVGRGYLTEPAPPAPAATAADESQVVEPDAEPALAAEASLPPAPAEADPGAEPEAEPAPIRVSLRRRLGLDGDADG